MATRFTKIARKGAKFLRRRARPDRMMEELTRFKIKEALRSRPSGTVDWATKSLRRRFISAGVQSTTQENPGLLVYPVQPTQWRVEFNLVSETIRLKRFGGFRTRFLFWDVSMGDEFEEFTVEWVVVSIESNLFLTDSDPVGGDTCEVWWPRCWCRVSLPCDPEADVRTIRLRILEKRYGADVVRREAREMLGLSASDVFRMSSGPEKHDRITQAWWKYQIEYGVESLRGQPCLVEAYPILAGSVTSKGVNGMTRYTFPREGARF